MKKMMKKAMAFLLALMLIVTMLAGTVFATEEATVKEEVTFAIGEEATVKEEVTFATDEEVAEKEETALKEAEAGQKETAFNEVEAEQIKETLNIAALANPAVIPNEIGNDSLPTVWGEDGKSTSYTVTASCTIEDRIEVKGDVTLMLNDSVELTLPKGIRLVAGNSLTINSQSQGENTGKLTATGTDGNAAIGGTAGFGNYMWLQGDDGETCGTLTVKGGSITAKGLGDSRGFGGGYGGEAMTYGGNGGGGGSLSILGGACEISSEYGAAIGGGTNGDAKYPGAVGVATELTLGAKISLLAGKDKNHLSDTTYTNQHCVMIGEFVTITFVISGKDPFTASVAKGSPMPDPLVADGENIAVWHTDPGYNNAYDFSKSIAGDMTLYGVWEYSPNVYEYVRWDAKGNPTAEAHFFFPDDPCRICKNNLPTTWGVERFTTWYVVLESCTIEERIEIKGDINLILADGVELTLPKGILLLEGNSLTIFSKSQSGASMGKLNATSNNKDCTIGSNTEPDTDEFDYGYNAHNCGTLTIHGGDITVKNTGNGHAFGGGNGGGAFHPHPRDYRNHGGNGGNGGSLSILGGSSFFSTESNAAIGGGTGGKGTVYGKTGAGTTLTRGSKISLLAGKDNEHLSNTYTDQPYLSFNRAVNVTFEISEMNPFTTVGIKELPVIDPRLSYRDNIAVWYTDSGCTNAYDFSLPVIGDMILYGKWMHSTYFYEFTRWDAQGNPTVESHVFLPDDPHIICKNNIVTTWESGSIESWYIVTESCTIDNRIEINGNVNLILVDGVELTLSKGIHLTEGNSLTVFSQDQNDKRGKLIATGTGGSAAIGGDAGLGEDFWAQGNNGDSCGTLTVHGGMVTAKGLGDSRGYGGGNGGAAQDNPGNGGNGGKLIDLGGTFIPSSESGPAVGGGTGGPAKKKKGKTGAATELTLGDIKVQAGDDAEHATDTKYNNQHYVKFIKAHVHTIDGKEIEFTPWTSDNSLPTKAGNYYLTKDVTLNDTWRIPTDKGVINLCLKGHVIKTTAGQGCIRVGSRTTLNLHDCNGDNCTHEGYVDDSGLWHLGSGSGTAVSITGGVITGGTDHGIFINNQAQFNMYGGTIAGNKASNGGGISNGGVFNMYGGEICYNTTGSTKSGKGGGLYVVSSLTSMYGGKIHNNVSGSGGGVSTNSGVSVFDMYGGEISNNKATYGGGVDIDYGIFKMHGGTITNNTATYGGGVFNYRQMIIGGSSVINNNTNDNLFVKQGWPITIGTGSNGVEAPTAGMKVGVTLPDGSGAFTNSCTVDYSTNFTADKAAFKVVYKNQMLYLENKSTPEMLAYFEKEIKTYQEHPETRSLEKMMSLLDAYEMVAQNPEIKAQMEADKELQAWIQKMKEDVKAKKQRVTSDGLCVSLNAVNGGDPNWRYVLSAETISTPEVVKAKLGKDWKVLDARDITVLRTERLTMEEKPTEGKFTFGFSGKDFAIYKNSEVIVYHVTENGIEELKPVWNEEKQCFEVTADSCSPFVFAVNTKSAPQTGDNNIIALLLALCVMALIAMASCIVTLKRRAR